MTDFFISYTSADKAWAEWIAYVLEEEGYSVVLQAWDFRPGSNFVLEMQQAALKAGRTIMVLSSDYLKSQFANSEWAAAFAKDPQGLKRKLLPVVVRPCEPDGLLGPIVHINLVEMGEAEARDTLIAGVRNERAKPSKRPAFPGETPEKHFPGSSSVVPCEPVAQPYMPKVKRIASDMDKRRFSKAAFDTIKDYFEHALQELARHTRGLEFDFQPVTALEFTAEVFLAGKSVAVCRIRQGGDSLSQGGITYAEGRHHHGSNSYNEILSITEDQGEPALHALMGAFSFGPAIDFDHERMTPTQSAEYLWRRFIHGLDS